MDNECADGETEGYGHVFPRVYLRLGVLKGQLENTETRERKREREREREGTPKTEVNIFDPAAHNKAIVFQTP